MIGPPFPAFMIGSEVSALGSAEKSKGNQFPIGIVTDLFTLAYYNVEEIIFLLAPWWFQ